MSTNYSPPVAGVSEEERDPDEQASECRAEAENLLPDRPACKQHRQTNSHPSDAESDCRQRHPRVLSELVPEGRRLSWLSGRREKGRLPPPAMPCKRGRVVGAGAARRANL